MSRKSILTNEYIQSLVVYKDDLIPLDCFEWDKRTATFSTFVSGIYADFSLIPFMNIICPSKSSIRAGYGCFISCYDESSIYSGGGSVIRCGRFCKIKCGSFSTIHSSGKCNIKCGNNSSVHSWEGSLIECMPLSTINKMDEGKTLELENGGRVKLVEPWNGSFEKLSYYK